MEPDRLVAAEQTIVDQLDAKLVAGQDQVIGDPASSTVNGVPLERLADEPRGDRNGVGFPGDRFVEPVKLRAERLGDGPPLAGLRAGENGHAIAGLAR